MAERWKAWKTKIRFPKLPPAPWKSRKNGEIPTFPPLRLFLCVHINTAEAKELWAVEKWKSKSRIPTFPQPRQPAAQGIAISQNPTPTEPKGQLSTADGHPRFQYHLALE